MSKHPMKSPGILLASALFFAGVEPCLPQNQDASHGNVIVIGWDGTQRAHLLDLVRAGKMPHFKALTAEGSFAPTQVTTGETQTKSGWTEIFTGYNSSSLGVTNNRDYRPIPKGLTVFERLKRHFGSQNLAVLFIGGKSYNIGSRGPHDVCDNCIGRDPINHRLSLYWDRKDFRSVKNGPVTRDGLRPHWVQREGEPFFHAREAFDEHHIGLGAADEVGTRALKLLEKYRDRRFFAFIHFEEPDEQGHLYNENSEEYEQALMTVDGWLGKILQRLKELQIDQRTTVFITTDHGMDEGQFDHHESPETFFATNHKGPFRAGDRKDIAPTIMACFGVNPADFTPAFEGMSLMRSTFVDFALGDVRLPFDGVSITPPTTDIINLEVKPTPALQSGNSPLRIGYFHGGRTVMIYRTHVFDYFSREKVKVELHTKWLNDDKVFKVPDDHDKAEAIRAGRKFFGKMDGMEIIQKMLDGEFDGGTVGEASFLSYASRGAPIVAVAMLGHDVRGEGGKGIVFRKDVIIRSPADLRNKTLVSRRAGPGDAIFLREFLESVGMASDKSIKILDDLDEDEVVRLLEEGKIDGGLYHLLTLKSVIEERKSAYLYRPMDWMNPELSHSLLVFRKDIVTQRPDWVERIVRAYMKRIQFERSLPPDVRESTRESKSLMMELRFQGMSIPSYDFPPLVRLDLLREMHRLLVKYHFASGDPDLRNHIDNSFIERAMHNLATSR